MLCGLPTTGLALAIASASRSLTLGTGEPMGELLGVDGLDETEDEGLPRGPKWNKRRKRSPVCDDRLPIGLPLVGDALLDGVSDSDSVTAEGRRAVRAP